MPRKKFKTEVIKRITVEYSYDVLVQGVPDDGVLRSAFEEAMQDHEEEDGTAILRDGVIASLKTTIRKVPLEEPQG